MARYGIAAVAFGLGLLVCAPQLADAAAPSPLCAALDAIGNGPDDYLVKARGALIGVRPPQTNVAFGSPATETSYQAPTLIPGAASCVSVFSEYPDGSNQQNFLRCQWPLGADGGKTLKALTASMSKCWTTKAKAVSTHIDPIFSNGSVYITKSGLDITLELKNIDTSITVTVTPTPARLRG